MAACKNCATGKACTWHKVGNTNVSKHATKNGGVIGRRTNNKKNYKRKLNNE